MVSWSTSTLDWYDTPGPSHFLSWCSVNAKKKRSAEKFSLKIILLSLNPKTYWFIKPQMMTTTLAIQVPPNRG